MKILSYILIFFLMLTSCEKESPSIQIFNGKNLDSWNIDIPSMDSLSNMNPPFIVRNGNLVSLGEPRGHLITTSLMIFIKIIVFLLNTDLLVPITDLTD